MRHLATVSPQEERLERQVEQLELAHRVCESTLQQYKDAIVRDLAPNVERLLRELWELDVKVSLDDLNMALRAADLRVVAWRTDG